MRAERDAAVRYADDLRYQLTDARTERDEWKARHDAREAELNALRAEQRGLPWWRRLLGTSPAMDSEEN